jgi:hypothetical protein
LQDPISKIARAKCTVGMAQVVGCLLCNCETLSSNPNPIKKRKKDIRKRRRRSRIPGWGLELRAEHLPSMHCKK